MLRCTLPDEIRLPTGEILMPVIGGHLGQQPFLTVEHSHVDVRQNGWANGLVGNQERRLIIGEAKRQKLKYRVVSVLSRELRGKLDLHQRPYTPNKWVFVQVKAD